MLNDNMVKDCFQRIIKNYNLEFGKIDENQFALYSGKFAIIISLSQDGVTIEYAMRDKNNTVEVFETDSYISRKFDDRDRIGIGNPVTIHDILVAELKITAAGLENHWSALLNGNTSWIDDFMHDQYGGLIRQPNNTDRQFLERILWNN